MILNFKTQKQMQGNWCWAAVTSSVSFFFTEQSAWTQNVIVGNMIDSSCFDIGNGSSPVCDVVNDAATALYRTGNFSGQLQRCLELNEIMMQIDSGYPVCCQITWPGINISHFVVIYGYDGNNLIIGDTQAGVTSCDYNQFLTDYRTGGNWVRTIGVRKP